MENLIGLTFRYIARGKKDIVPVTVVDAFDRDGESFYKTFFPLARRYSEHSINLFHEIFGSEIRRKLGKRWGKGAKGKLKNKNIID